MKTYLFAFILLFVVSMVPACETGTEPGAPGQPEETGQPGALGEPEQEDDLFGQQQEPDTGVFGAEQQTVTGELGNVDMQAMTLSVTDEAGMERQFRFDDSTQIIGAAGTQALAGEQGSRVTVHYEDSEEQVPLAVQIEVNALGTDSPSEPSGQPGQ